jgi:glycosyltransferase involved in cell wall biosynthesis
MKILSVCPSAADGTSWYRCSGPLSRMEMDYEDVSYIEYGSQDVSWDVLARFDVLFLQRPHTNWHLRLANKALFMGLKVWIDFDDLLWDLPNMHRNYHDYNKEEYRMALHGLANLPKGQSLITVSTYHLSDMVKKHFNDDANVHVVPNAINEKVFPRHKISFAENADMIGWRGSDTHDIDLMYVEDNLFDVPEQYKFDFFGYVPKRLAIEAKNVGFTRPCNLLEYFAHLVTAKKWRIFWVYLHDNDFNRSKSNIAWMEATLAGAICVANSLPEWTTVPCVNYEYPMHLANRIQQAMGMDSDSRYDLWRKSRDLIYDQYTLEKTNKLRYELLTNLLKN